MACLQKLYPFPFLHPSMGQLQLDLTRPDLRRFPNFRGATAYEVSCASARLQCSCVPWLTPEPCAKAVLKPGDVLYLPPLWYATADRTDT